MPNTIVKEVAQKQVFPDVKAYTTSVCSYAQGDIQIYDTTNNIVRAPTGEAEGSAMLGIAALDITSGKPVSPYSTATDASQAVPALNGPLYGITALLVLKSADILYKGQYVYAYPTGGANQVAATAASTATAPIALYVGGSTVTGDGVIQVECLIGARYPNNTLKF